MKTEKVHTVVIGAGPAGLAAGYTLAKAGLKPVVVERDKVPGGLMRSLRHGEFILDVGRKELYNRIEKVDRFWGDLLGADYRPYSHRGGLLYEGKVIDYSPEYQGFRRGMPWPMFAGCVWDFAWAQLAGRRAQPSTVEEYFYKKRGRLPTRIFSQGFQEKLNGRRWADIPMPKAETNGNGHDESEGGALATLRAALDRTFSKKEVNTFEGRWRHPAKGTGQICDALAKGIIEAGGRIDYGAQLKEMKGAEGRVQMVAAEIGGERVEYQAGQVVSSLPIEFLVQMLLNRRVETGASKDVSFRKKTVILVYLFLNEPPRFPHAYLHVTCPKSRSGRITNYAAYNGDMVPPGKTALCCEYYCFGDDPLLKLTDQEWTEKAAEECASSGLIDRKKFADALVLRLPGADASQNRDNWMSAMRIGLMAELKPFTNLYYVSRTELDIATLAGMEAGEAIISGQRADFDRRVDPAELGIRSGKKSFEFKMPAGIS